jgi:hypothetical protein
LSSPTGSILAAQPQVLDNPVRVALLNGLKTDINNSSESISARTLPGDEIRVTYTISDADMEIPFFG